MARGRMLNRKIAMNKAVAELYDRAGAEAVLVYTWVIAFLDVDGRIHGDPEVLKGLICPRLSGITPAVIRHIAGIAAEVGLIDWYQVEGEAYISYPKFRENQAGLRVNREPPSDFPPPSGILPDQCRQDAGRVPEEIPPKRMEEKVREEKVIGDKDPAARQAASPKAAVSSAPSGVVSVFERWKKYHDKARLTAGHRGLIARRLKAGYTVDDLCAAIDGIHLDDWPDREKYLSLKYALKDDASIERFIGFAGNPPRKALSPALQTLADIALEESNGKQGTLRGVYDAPTRLLPEHGED